jgi:hypothetical protein
VITGGVIKTHAFGSPISATVLTWAGNSVCVDNASSVNAGVGIPTQLEDGEQFDITKNRVKE